MSMTQLKEAVREGAMIEVVTSGEGLTGGPSGRGVPAVVDAENPTMDYGPQKIADIRCVQSTRGEIALGGGANDRHGVRKDARNLATGVLGCLPRAFRSNLLRPLPCFARGKHEEIVTG